MNTKNLTLYKFDGCPYCERVRGTLSRLGLDIEMRDILASPEHRAELRAATGRQTVPCLRIEDGSGNVEWMHESRDIIAYLEQHFAAA